MLLNINELAKKQPNKSAYVLTESNTAITFKDLQVRINKTMHLFNSFKLSKGDHIAVMLENSLEFFNILWASLNSGLCFTPISIHAKFKEVEYMVGNCDAKLFIYSTTLINSEQVLVLKHTVDAICLPINGGTVKEKSWVNLVSEAPATSNLDQCIGKIMFYTSGTTGKAKGVIHKGGFKNNITVNDPEKGIKFSNGIYGVNNNSVFLSNGQLYHTGPLGNSMFFTQLGVTVLVSKKFDPVQILSNIEKFRVSHSFMVPTMFKKLLQLSESDKKRYDLKSLKMIMHSGEVCDISVKSKMIDWMGSIITEYYGGTEGNGVTIISSEEWKSHKGSVGRSIHGKVHVVNSKTNVEVNPGEIGTIYFENGTPFEYYKDIEKTKSSRHPEGWTTMGDKGFVDKEGYLYLVGRVDDTIISGGVNVYPKEVEDILNEHSKVHESVVVGVKDKKFGQVAVGFVVLEEELDTQEKVKIEEALLLYCRESLSKIKCPKKIMVLDELPVSATGKVLRSVLREKMVGPC